MCETTAKCPKTTQNVRENHEKTPIKQGIFEKEGNLWEFPKNPLKPAQRNPVLGEPKVLAAVWHQRARMQKHNDAYELCK